MSICFLDAHVKKCGQSNLFLTKQKFGALVKIAKQFATSKLAKHLIIYSAAPDPGDYFRFVGLLVQNNVLIANIFHIGIHTCILFSSTFNWV